MGDYCGDAQLGIGRDRRNPNGGVVNAEKVKCRKCGLKYYEGKGFLGNDGLCAICNLRRIRKGRVVC